MAVPSLCTKASPCFSADGVNCEVPTHSAPWPDYRRGVFPSFATLISGCILCIYSSSSVFFPLTLILNMGNFPQGTLAVSRGTFVVTTWWWIRLAHNQGVGAFLILWIKTRHAAKHPTVTRTAPPN